MPKENTQKEQKTKNIHEGHRQRLKNKFMNLDEEILEDHEFVEMMLFYAIPQKNVNELAHRLVEGFGSFANILEADKNLLLEYKGVGEHVVSLMKFILACAREYSRDKNDILNTRLTPMNIENYVKGLFYGHKSERAYAILINANFEVKRIKKITLGTESRADLDSKDILKFAVNNDDCPYMILAHNHPNGSAIASREDLDTTKIIINALSYINVKLLDHMIVTENRVTSIRENYDIINE